MYQEVNVQTRTNNKILGRPLLATKRKVGPAPADDTTASYQHAQEAVQRPDVGVQDHFSARKPPKMLAPTEN